MVLRQLPMVAGGDLRCDSKFPLPAPSLSGYTKNPRKQEYIRHER